MSPGFWYSTLGALESCPVLDTVTKEVAGINVPKIAVTRSDTERMDVAVSEIGNTLAFGVGGVAADQVFQRVFQSAQSAAASQTQKHWAELGRSVGIYSVIFSLMWAMPFVRNYVTAKRTGHVKFTDVIAANKQQASDNHQNHKTTLQDNLAYYRNRALGILGLGVAGALASVGFTRWASSAGREIGKEALDKLISSWAGKNLLLKKGEFARFGGWPALLFWGFPAYGGWIQASRDPYEKKEQLLKFGNFVACFSGPSVVLKYWFSKSLDALALPKIDGEAVELTHESLKKAKTYLSEHVVPNHAQLVENLQKAEGLWLKKSGLGLVSSIVLLGTMPQVINIHLTRRRLKRDLPAQQTARWDEAPASPYYFLPGGPIFPQNPSIPLGGPGFGWSLPAYPQPAPSSMAPHPYVTVMSARPFLNAQGYNTPYGRLAPGYGPSSQLWGTGAF